MGGSSLGPSRARLRVCRRSLAIVSRHADSKCYDRTICCSAPCVRVCVKTAVCSAEVIVWGGLSAGSLLPAGLSVLKTKAARRAAAG
jgi:hypothetical protein